MFKDKELGYAPFCAKFKLINNGTKVIEINEKLKSQLLSVISMDLILLNNYKKFLIAL